MSIVELIAIIAVAVVTIILVAQGLPQRSRDEYKHLAEARGEEIKDLQHQINAMEMRHSGEIEVLRIEMSAMQAQMEVLKREHAEYVAQRVVDQLLPFLDPHKGTI